MKGHTRAGKKNREAEKYLKRRLDQFIEKAVYEGEGWDGETFVRKADCIEAWKRYCKKHGIENTNAMSFALQAIEVRSRLRKVYGAMTSFEVATQALHLNKGEVNKACIQIIHDGAYAREVDYVEGADRAIWEEERNAELCKLNLIQMYKYWRNAKRLSVKEVSDEN